MGIRPAAPCRWRARGVATRSARLADVRFPGDSVQSPGEARHRTIDIVQLVEAEQAETEGLEIVRLVAAQRNPGGDLQATADNVQFKGLKMGARAMCHAESAGWQVAGSCDAVVRA